MQTGAELTTFITSVNTGNTIDATLLTVLVDTAKTILEGERPWYVLRKTDTSLTVTTANTWQTSKSLSGITDFSGRFYGNRPVKLFDGTNLVAEFRQVPIEDRLRFKDSSGTFCYDANAGVIYLNGVLPSSGTLYINYIANSTEIDLTSNSAVWSVFPKRFLPMLGYYAVGINKGAIDWDTINQSHLPATRDVMAALKLAMTKWDDELQQNSLDEHDPTEYAGGFRGGHINRDEY